MNKTSSSNGIGKSQEKENKSIKIRKYYLCQIYKQSHFVNFYKSFIGKICIYILLNER